MDVVDTGNTAWLLISSALVLLMTPGLAFFYGGMVRAKSVLNMMMMSFVAIAAVTIIWVAYGYSIAYGNDIGLLFGDLSLVGLSDLLFDESAGYPAMADVAFQAMFAIITVALISGAIADRAKFGAWIVFAVVWATLVYFPVAHWVWGGGWVGEIGALDFAGGTAVHINAGAAALALTFVLGKRRGWPKEQMRPHNLPFVLLGAALLWFGWVGFNAGSAYAADNTAAIAFLNTQVATAAAVIGWLVLERLRDGHATSLGAASGAVAGLVAITPACAYVDVWGAMAIGLAAGLLCAGAVTLKYKLGYDDSLDVVGVHMVGGLVGSLLIGLFARAALSDGEAGLFNGGGLSLLGIQAVASFGVLAYSLVMSYIIGMAIDKTMGFRVDAEEESEGIDAGEHAETAYDFSQLGGGGGIGGSSAPLQRKAAESGKVEA
jgi:Amt family ammonium transporter